MASIEMKSTSEDGLENDNNYHSRREPEVAPEQTLKYDLQKHFQNPFSDCLNSRTCRPGRTPVKLAVIAIKLVFVIVTVMYNLHRYFDIYMQLVQFGNKRASFAKYLDRNNLALKRLLLQDWSNLYETMPYPPATGQYALYSIDEFIGHINHTVHKVSSLHLTSVGSFFASNNEGHPVTICVEYYDFGVYNITTKDIVLDQTTRKVCSNVGTNTRDDYNLNPSISDLMRGDNGALVRLTRVEVGFTVDSIHMDMNNPYTSPRCLRIHGTILFDNSDINGQIPVQLQSNVWEMVCTLNGSTSSRSETSVFVLGSISILVTVFSLVLCSCSVFKSVNLCCKTRKYIRAKFGTPLPLSDQLEIVNTKEIITMVGDVILLVGLLLFIVLNSTVLRSPAFWYDTCGVLFGTGFILVCFGALHFLSFSKGFHILFDVMGKSVLPVLRFLACAAILYVSFALCGWIVMGPYHIKFASIYSTFRCLFGLIAGDEIYVTLAAIDDQFSFPWWFCAVFVTLYTTIFTIVALNILIAIFSATYESIKNQTVRNQVKSALIRFMDD